jgi:hypothetical protein
VKLPSNVTVTTGSGGTDINGNFTAFAGASSGDAIAIGNVDTRGANNGTGNIYLLTNNPNTAGNISIVNGRIISGSFRSDPLQYPTTTANIIVGNLSSSGGSIQALAGGTLTLGNVNSSGANAAGRNGGISMVGGAPTGIAISAGDLTTAGATIASGNILLITSAPALQEVCAPPVYWSTGRRIPMALYRWATYQQLVMWTSAPATIFPPRR